MATEPGEPSAFSKARLANVTDLNGLRIELAEIGPGVAPAQGDGELEIVRPDAEPWHMDRRVTL